MGTKMLSVFMLTQSGRSFRFCALLLSVGALTSACRGAPLLAPAGSTITLTPLATALPLNGSTQIIAQVIEPAGTPPQHGTQLTFTTTLGTIEPDVAETDSSGRIVVTFRAGNQNGVATIVAISGGVASSGANAVKIALGTAAVGGVRLAANPTIVPASGGSSTITASVFDINGNPLTSAPVLFSTTAGTLDTL